MCIKIPYLSSESIVAQRHKSPTKLLNFFFSDTLGVNYKSIIQLLFGSGRVRDWSYKGCNESCHQIVTDQAQKIQNHNVSIRMTGLKILTQFYIVSIDSFFFFFFYVLSLWKDVWHRLYPMQSMVWRGWKRGERIWFSLLQSVVPPFIATLYNIKSSRLCGSMRCTTKPFINECSLLCGYHICSTR